MHGTVPFKKVEYLMQELFKSRLDFRKDSKADLYFGSTRIVQLRF